MAFKRSSEETEYKSVSNAWGRHHPVCKLDMPQLQSHGCLKHTVDWGMMLGLLHTTENLWQEAYNLHKMVPIDLHLFLLLYLHRKLLIEPPAYKLLQVLALSWHAKSCYILSLTTGVWYRSLRKCYFSRSASPSFPCPSITLMQLSRCSDQPSFNSQKSRMPSAEH